MPELQNDDIDEIPGSIRLPKEVGLNPSRKLKMEYALRQLLQDLDMLDNRDVKEIASRVRLESLSKLFVIVKWKPEQWVWHLGSRTAWRLRDASYWLSCMSHIDVLVAYLENASLREGWVLTLSEVHFHAFELAITSVVSLARWNKDLKRAVRNEIEQLSRPSEHPSTSNGTRDGSLFTTWSHMEQPRNDNCQMPPTSIAIPGFALELEQLDETEEGTADSKEQVDQNSSTVPWKKQFLKLLFWLNLISVLFTIKYGFSVDYGGFFPDPPKPRPPIQPTLSPTPAPVQTLTYAPTKGTDWEQMGAELEGKTPADKFGWSVSLSSYNYVLAVGAPQELGSGQVHIYKFDTFENTWKNYGQVLSSDQMGAEFGNSTDLSDDGNILAVGARNKNNMTGQVQVFRYFNGTWNPKGQPLNGEKLGDNFGSAVSLAGSGNLLAVSAATHDIPGVGEDVGLVQVFQYNSDDDWWYQLGNDLPGAEPYEKFGFSTVLSASGNVVAVGAPFYKRTQAGNQTKWGGRVNIYKYSEDDNKWDRLGDSLLHTSPDDRFGWALDLSSNGQIVAIGAPLNEENGEASGIVRVMEYKPSVKTWQQLGETIQGQDLGRWFANTVCLSSTGLTLAVALWCDAENRPKCPYGGIRVYGYIRNRNIWAQMGGDVPGQTLYDPFASSVDMGKDETIIMTGLSDSGASNVRAYKPAFGTST